MILTLVICSCWLSWASVDRLRCMNWHTVKPSYVLIHLCYAIGGVGTIYDIYNDVSFSWYRFDMIIGALCWFHISRYSWEHGVPEHVKR